MGNIINFFRDYYIELTKKVTWPTFKELQKSSVLVLIASVIFALVIWAMDLGFGTVLGWFYGTR